MTVPMFRKLLGLGPDSDENVNTMKIHHLASSSAVSRSGFELTVQTLPFSLLVLRVT